MDRAPGGPTVRLECRDVVSGYGGSEVLHGISFTLDEPAVYVVLGPNGAGKTTLFRTIAGVLPLRRGSISVSGDRNAPGSAARQLHYLSHVDGIPDGLRVREALEFYARVESAGPTDVDRVLDALQIREFSDRYLAQLSAGQRKRVAIARVFLRERSIYLLDEPTSSLDPKVAREIRGLILELAREKVVLYSSHNLFEAREIGRSVLVLRAGRLALFDRIENLRAARYLVGIRVLEPNAALDGLPRQGEYYLKELAGPEGVPPLVHELEAQGVRIRELREMENPLEELFT